MSVFSDVPSQFPLHVSLKRRPVTYRLECAGPERAATLLLSLMWGIAIPAVLLSLADPFAPWPDAALPIDRIAAVAGLALFLAFGVRSWLWPNVRAALSRIEVGISATEIEVAELRLPVGQRWSKPISDYQGVAIENWATRSVGNDKIPIAAIMIVHRDDRFSVPIHIDRALKVKESIARGKASQLGLPLIDAPKFGLGAKAHAPGTIVINHAQALKVRVLYAALGLGGLGAAIAAITAYASAGDPLYIALAISGLGLAAAIHLYASCYVTAMRRIDDTLEIETAVPLLGTHRIARQRVRDIAYREGRGGRGTDMRTHTPWVKIRVDGSRLPFIVDTQSDLVDEAALIGLEPRRAGDDRGAHRRSQDRQGQA